MFQTTNPVGSLSCAGNQPQSAHLYALPLPDPAASAPAKNSNPHPSELMAEPLWQSVPAPKSNIETLLTFCKMHQDNSKRQNGN